MNDYKPERKTVGDLFSQRKRLVIPRYQRTYEWREANINDFYSDFVATHVDGLDFLGNIVVDASNSAQYEIIDGQQRLITLSILFAVIRDILREDIHTDKSLELATDINSTFLKMGTSFSGENNSNYKITPSKDLDEFFFHYIQEGGESRRQEFNKQQKKPSHRNVINAYRQFRRLLTEEKLSGNHSDNDKVEFLRRAVSKLESVTLIVIEIYDQNAAFTIFESFNAKRVDLSIADLVKNYYYSKLGGSDEQKEKDMDRWDKIVSRVSLIGKLDRFLHCYYQSTQGRFPRSQLYRKVRADIDADPGKFIKNLDNASVLYCQLKTEEIEQDDRNYIPYEHIRRINNSLNGICRFNVEQCFIFLLALMLNKSKLTPIYISRFVEMVEKFTFIYSKIGNGQANILESVYGDFAKELSDSMPTEKPDIFSGQLFAKLQKVFEKHVPKFESFKSHFKDLDYEKSTDKKLIQYIFDMTERYNTNNGTMLGDLSNIDHIFPQNPPQGIKPLRDRHKIGNLLPIDRATNSKIGNQLPEAKIDIYKNISNITQVKEYLDFAMQHGSELTDELIEKRSEIMAEKAYNKIWFIAKQ